VIRNKFPIHFPVHPVAKPLLFSALLVLMSSGLVACKSGPKEPYGDQRKRDYYSSNKRSVSFLMDSFRQDRVERRENQRQFWNWSEIRADNKRIRKESVRFFVESLALGEIDNFKRAWGTGLPRELRGVETRSFGESVRFGFLDSGD